MRAAKLDAVIESSGQTRGIDGIAFDRATKRAYVATRTGLLAGNDDGSAAVPFLAPAGTLTQTQCVDVHDGALYACSSQFPPDNAAIAQSIDGAQSFHSILNYVDTVGPVDCPAGTPVGDLCPSYWYMYGAQLGISFDGGIGGNDAGRCRPRAAAAAPSAPSAAPPAAWCSRACCWYWRLEQSRGAKAARGGAIRRMRSLRGAVHCAQSSACVI